MRADSESSNHGLEEIRGAQAYFRALQRDFEPEQLTRSFVVRFAQASDYARRRIVSDQLLREALPAVRTRFLDMTAAISEAATGTRVPNTMVDPYWCDVALKDAMIYQVKALIEDRADYKRTIEIEMATMSPPDIKRLIRVNKEIVNGLAMGGIEQGECMRTAGTEIQALLEDTTGPKNPIAWLIEGWLILWSSSTSTEACNYFGKGIALLSDHSSFLAYLLHRFRAVALDLAGRPAEALDEARLALALRPRPELLLETSRYALQAGERLAARTYLEEAIRQEPLMVFLAMADADLSSLEAVIFTCYGQAERIVTASAQKALVEWQSVVIKAHESEKQLGVPLELPAEICVGFTEMRSHASIGGLLGALGVRSIARQNAAELYVIATRRVNAIVQKRKGDSENAKQAVEAMTNKRDTVKARAQTQAETLISKMELELQHSMSHDDRAAQGCATGLGGSFAMFMVYVVASGLLSQRGIETGWDSPFGMIGICLIASPLAIGIGANTASGIKRSAVGSEVQRRAAHAREMAKVTVIEVEKNCAQQAERLKSEAVRIEERTRSAVEAQRILSEAPRPLEVRPTNPESSRLAA